MEVPELAVATFDASYSGCEFVEEADKGVGIWSTIDVSDVFAFDHGFVGFDGWCRECGASGRHFGLLDESTASE